MEDFDINKNEGSMFIECRTDGGVSIFVNVSRNHNAVTLPLTKLETMELAKWLSNYLWSNSSVGK